nr:hypothetical protein [Nocardiopsis chromatogenes]
MRTATWSATRWWNAVKGEEVPVVRSAAHGESPSGTAARKRSA